jgi:hypothetical protein
MSACPGAGCANAPVRFDEGGVETGITARPLRHRQTKGAETDTPGLTFTAPHSYSTVNGRVSLRLFLIWYMPVTQSR